MVILLQQIPWRPIIQLSSIGGTPPIPTAAAFRVCHELSCTRRSAGSKERCCRGGFLLFSLGEFGVVIKGWCRREKLHHSPLGGGFSIHISQIYPWCFNPLECLGSSCFQPPSGGFAKVRRATRRIGTRDSRSQRCFGKAKNWSCSGWTQSLATALECCFSFCL